MVFESKVLPGEEVSMNVHPENTDYGFVANGKIVKSYTFYNEADALEQLGYIFINPKLAWKSFSIPIIIYVYSTQSI